MSSEIEKARHALANASKPMSFSGAGLSAESGIATFRGDNEHALWSQFDPTQLASQHGFKKDPKLVIDWYNWRRKSLANAKPNAAHTTLGKQRGWLHVTQNVDNLLELGGAAGNQVLHLHGTLLSDHCNAQCGYKESIALDNPPALRNCYKCGNPMRPSVVWFGEALPEDILNQAANATSVTDLLLVVGTSAQVYPAAGLIDIARQHQATIVIVDPEADAVGQKGDILIREMAAKALPCLFAR